MSTSTCQGAPHSVETEALVLGPIQTSLYVSHPATPLYPLIFNKPADLLPRSESFSKLLKPEERTVVTPNYSLSVRSTDDNVGLATGH